MTVYWFFIFLKNSSNWCLLTFSFFIFQVSSSKRSPVGLVICFNDALLKILQWEAYCQIIFPKKKRKNTSSFTSKNHWCKLNPVWESRTGTPKRLWWILYEYDGHFFLCFFTIYNIYNYLLTITSMHKFFLAPHLLGPLLLFVKKILISRRIRYKTSDLTRKKSRDLIFLESMNFWWTQKTLFSSSS